MIWRRYLTDGDRIALAVAARLHRDEWGWTCYPRPLKNPAKLAAIRLFCGGQHWAARDLVTVFLGNNCVTASLLGAGRPVGGREYASTTICGNYRITAKPARILREAALEWIERNNFEQATGRKIRVVL